VPTKGKTRITICIDDQIGAAEKPMTAEQLQKIVRDELAHAR
jgi:hypothetical protein